MMIRIFLQLESCTWSELSDIKFDEEETSHDSETMSKKESVNAPSAKQPEFVNCSHGSSSEILEGAYIEDAMRFVQIDVTAETN